MFVWPKNWRTCPFLRLELLLHHTLFLLRPGFFFLFSLLFQSKLPSDLGVSLGLLDRRRLFSALSLLFLGLFLFD